MRRRQRGKRRCLSRFIRLFSSFWVTCVVWTRSWIAQAVVPFAVRNTEDRRIQLFNLSSHRLDLLKKSKIRSCLKFFQEMKFNLAADRSCQSQSLQAVLYVTKNH